MASRQSFSMNALVRIALRVSWNVAGRLSMSNTPKWFSASTVAVDLCVPLPPRKNRMKCGAQCPRLRNSRSGER